MLRRFQFKLSYCEIGIKRVNLILDGKDSLKIMKLDAPMSLDPNETILLRDDSNDIYTLTLKIDQKSAMPSPLGSL